MKSILEIPVISANVSLWDSIFTGEIKGYQDFKLAELEINNEKSIYFFLFSQIPHHGDELFLDQIIPKAPFSFVLVDPLEDINQSKTGGLCHDYIDNYETPLVFWVLTGDEELKNNFKNEALISENNAPIVLADPAKKDALKTALQETFKQITPEIV